jgi:hypothetical protein
MRHLTHGVTGEVLSLSWAPDSSGLATLELNHKSGERAVGIRSQARGSHMHAVPHGLVVSRVAWSPDGALLALSGPLCAQTVLFDPASGTVRRTLDNLSGPVAWQPGGRLLAGIYETSVLLCDPATGGRVGRLAGQEHPPTAIAWARHGKFLAVADGERIRVWDADAGTEVSVIPWTTGEGDRGPDGKITSIEWLDGGRYLLEFRPRGGAAPPAPRPSSGTSRKPGGTSSSCSTRCSAVSAAPSPGRSSRRTAGVAPTRSTITRPPSGGSTATCPTPCRKERGYSGTM